MIFEDMNERYDALSEELEESAGTKCAQGGIYGSIRAVSVTRGKENY